MNRLIKQIMNIKKLVYQVHTLHYTKRPDIYVDGNPLPFEYFTKMLNDPESFNYVYEQNNEICGLLMATKKISRSIPITKQRITYFIEDIVVDEFSRRKGIAKKLYNFLIDKAISENVDAIELNVWSFNESAIRFYESLGMSVKNMKLEQLLKNKNMEAKKIDLTITNKVNE